MCGQEKEEWSDASVENQNSRNCQSTRNLAAFKKKLVINALQLLSAVIVLQLFKQRFDS